MVHLYLDLARLRFLAGCFLRAVYHVGHAELSRARQLQSRFNGWRICRPGDHAEYRSHRDVPVGHASERRIGEPNDFGGAYP